MTQPRPVYRTGRRVGRTIYVQTSDEPTDDDQIIGMLDTRSLAQFAVDAMNLAVRAAAQRLEPPGDTISAAAVAGAVEAVLCDITVDGTDEQIAVARRCALAAWEAAGFTAPGTGR